MLKIREATINDSEAIINFQIAMALETEHLKLDVSTVKKGVRNVFSDFAKGKYFVGEVDGHVVASLMITYEWSDWRNGYVWWIQSVYIEPKFRGLKIFKKMYMYLKEVVKNDDTLIGIRLYVDKTNINAQKVYKKIGMNSEHYQMYEWMKNL